MIETRIIKNRAIGFFSLNEIGLKNQSQKGKIIFLRVEEQHSRAAII